MSDARVEQLFSTLDAWRHLPDYQLERRADVFFSLYLREVLEAELGVALHPEVIPELPIRRGLIEPGCNGPNLSKKVDYAAWEPEGGRVWLVELKTDMASRRAGQDDYLERARRVGFSALVDGIRTITLKTQQRRKYMHLLHALERWGFLALPAELRAVSSTPRAAWLQRVEVKGDASVEIVYVQPLADPDGARVVSFERFAQHVERSGDPLSLRFARSLRAWSEIDAGTAPCGPWGAT